MKKPKDNLFRLIRSMSPAEKRYFKRHFSADQSLHTVLFDAINGQTVYDEAAIRQRLGEVKAKNLKVAKVQLTKLLLKSLSSLHYQKTPESKVRQDLEEVDILLDKQLHDLAIKRLKKLKKYCERYEMHTYLYEVLYKTYRIQHIRLDRPGISKLPLFDELETIANHLQRHNQMFRFGYELQDEVGRLQALRDPRRMAYFKQVLESELFTADPSHFPFRTRLSRNAALTFIYRALGRRSDELACRKENVDLFEAYAHFKASMPLTYIGAIRNYLNFCVHYRLAKEYQRVAQMGKAFAKEYKKMEIHLAHLYYTDLCWYQRRGLWRTLYTEVAPIALKHLEKYAITKDRIAALTYFQLGFCYLVTEDYKQAQSYVNRLWKITGQLEKNWLHLIFFLEAINHYQAGDLYSFERSIKDWKRKARSITLEDRSAFMKSLVKFFRSLLKRPFQKTAQVKTFLAQLENHSDDPMYKLFHFYQFDVWLEALAQEKTMLEVGQRKWNTGENEGI